MTTREVAIRTLRMLLEMAETEFDERPEGADELTEVLSDALDRLVPARRVAIAKCPECERETGP